MTPSHVDWKAAALIGAGVGVVFLFATAGNPWAFSALIVPTVMGREMPTVNGPHFSFGFMAVHLGLATVFGVAMAPVIHRLRIGAALAVGVLFGLFFYAINWVLFHYLFPIHNNPTELGVLLTNVAFALLVTAAYRGKVRGDSRRAGR